VIDYPAKYVFYLFISISRQRRSSQRDMWPRKDKGEEGQRPSSIGPLKQMKSVALHSALCARSTPLQIRNDKKREEQFNPLLRAPLQFPRLSTRPFWPRVPRPHPFHQPLSFPPQTTLRNGQTAFPTWDWLTIPGHPGFFPSHASILADWSFSLGQWSIRTCDRVIFAGPWQNQQLSSARFRIRLR